MLLILHMEVFLNGKGMTGSLQVIVVRDQDVNGVPDQDYCSVGFQDGIIASTWVMGLLKYDPVVSDRLS